MSTKEGNKPELKSMGQNIATECFSMISGFDKLRVETPKKFPDSDRNVSRPEKLAELTAKEWHRTLPLYNVGRFGRGTGNVKEVYGFHVRVLGREHKDTLSIRGRIAFII